MVIFQSYVCLPEGIILKSWDFRTAGDFSIKIRESSFETWDLIREKKTWAWQSSPIMSHPPSDSPPCLGTPEEAINTYQSNTIHNIPSALLVSRFVGEMCSSYPTKIGLPQQQSTRWQLKRSTAKWSFKIGRMVGWWLNHLCHATTLKVNWVFINAFSGDEIWSPQESDRNHRPATKSTSIQHRSGVVL